MSDPFFRPLAAGASAGYDVGLRAYMQRIFGYMASGLALTGAVAFLVAHTPLMGLFFTVLPTGQVHTTILGIIAMIAPLGFIIYMQMRMQRMSLVQIQTLFWVFSGLMGLSLSSIFLHFSQADIARAFFITAADFAAMSLYGYTTRRDLTGMGAFMMMGLLGLIIASVINLLLQSSGLQWVVSVMSVIIFTGLTAYQVQGLKQIYDENQGGETNTKLAVWGALSLYLSFLNLFQAILSLTGGNRNN
ncbi:MAG: Bax inhibitor-1/YccA family protein [Bdellovibrionales bacterium]